jgi:hypothetical protein
VRRTGRLDLLLTLVLVVGALGYFLSYARHGYMEDEGYVVEAVSRIMDGQVIYRDFHHTYAPGGSYLFALLFTLFGSSLLVVRVTWALLLAVKTGLAYAVGRKLMSRAFAILLAVLVTMLPGPWHKTFFSFTAFLLLWGMLRLVERPGVRTAFWIGLLTGVSALLRQDVAGFAAVGILASVGVRALGRKYRLRGRDFLRETAAYAAGILAVWIPVLVAFASAGALGDTLRALIFEGMKDNRTNRLPFPGLLPVTDYGRTHVLPVVMLKSLFYLTPVVLALTALGLVLGRVRRAPETHGGFVLGALILTLGCFNQSLWRADLPHLYQSLQPAYLLLVLLLWSLYAWLRSHWRTSDVRWVALPVLFLAPILFVGGPVLWACGQMDRTNAVLALQAENLYVRSVGYTGSLLLRRGEDTPTGLARAPLLVNENQARFLAVVGRYLDENTRPGEAILSVPGFQLVYFLYDRRNPTRYLHVRRSLGSREEEDRFIRDVEQSDTRVVLFTDMAIDGMPDRRFQVYAKRIYDWMTENYEYDMALGHTVFMKRKGLVTSDK